MARQPIREKGCTPPRKNHKWKSRYGGYEEDDECLVCGLWRDAAYPPQEKHGGHRGELYPLTAADVAKMVSRTGSVHLHRTASKNIRQRWTLMVRVTKLCKDKEQCFTLGVKKGSVRDA